GDAVDTRHADGHQHHVGAFAADQIDRLLAVGSFAGDLHVLLRLNDEAEAGAHHRLVVHDCDSDYFHAPHPNPLPCGERGSVARNPIATRTTFTPLTPTLSPVGRGGALRR